MTRWTGIIFVLGLMIARGGELADKLTVAGIAEFTAAYREWDARRFAAAAELFRRATTNATPSGTNFYWLGTAEFHRLLQLQSQPATTSSKLEAASATEAALAALSRAVQLDERHAESQALLGTLYGMKIDGNLLRALRFGPSVQKYRNLAMKFGADNPRVRYLLGTCQFHTATKPEALRAALASFLAAERLFATEAQKPAGPLEPRWGRSSCRTFVGRTYEQLGQRAEAAAYFQQALAEHPADHLAKEGLTRMTQRK
jgi:tetratricopeptide (TPR) repeat protein